MATDYNYVVPGVVPAIAQPNINTCWAAAATMLVSWRDQTSYTVEQVLEKAGPQYRAKLDANGGEGEVLRVEEKEDFLYALRLQWEQPKNYTVDGLFSLLQSYGPLWITTYEQFGTHAGILIRMSGDGSVDGTLLEVIDPGNGQTRGDSFREFGQKFEEVVDPNDESLTVQIVYC